MTPKIVKLGPTGEKAREVVEYLRKRQNLTYAELSRRTERAGRRIPEQGLRHIELGQRRVDVDDLASLAEALGVEPVVFIPTPADVRERKIQALAADISGYIDKMDPERKGVSMERLFQAIGGRRRDVAYVLANLSEHGYLESWLDGVKKMYTHKSPYPTRLT